MRIVTRPDFDGVVCAVLLSEALSIETPVFWAQPNDMQRGLVQIENGDIIANLPYHKNCAQWFDHHYSNAVAHSFEGRYEIAPSAAGIVFRHFIDRLQRDYHRLVSETDKIDSADLSLDEIRYPEKYPYILLSMTIAGRDDADLRYCDHLVRLLLSHEIEKVMEDPDVKKRCDTVVINNSAYSGYLQKFTTVQGNVSITDFRSLNPAPDGNRFLIYSLFPDTVVNVKIINDKEQMLIVKVGHSIVKRECRINVGKMLSRFEGGGHQGAGACRFHQDKAMQYIPAILDTLIRNEPNT